MFDKRAMLLPKREGKITTAGGRKLYRHESDMGTVMEFNDRRDRSVLILDAQYRAYNVMMTSEWTTDTSLPNMTDRNGNAKGNWYIHGGSSATTPSACASLTDATLNNLWANSLDTNSAKNNTDVWLTLPDCECATHCRSIKVNGVGCDIPDLQTLMRIFCEGVLLDELDPTVSSYPKLRLSDWFGCIGSEDAGPWSSCEGDKWTVESVTGEGFIYAREREGRFPVCPVLELDELGG